MSLTFPGPLVPVQWLIEHLEHPQLRILDATVVLPAARFDGDYQALSGEPGWRTAHIRGSRHADLQGSLHDAQATYSFALPTAAQLTTALQQLGIDAQSQVLVYDRSDGFWAARLWWMLRSVGIDAALLDGGLKAWQAAGQAVQSGPAQPLPAVAPLALQLRHELWADRQQVLAVSQGLAPGTLVCALSQAVFEGSAATRYHRRGHIPASLNRPARQLFDEHGHYLDAPALRAALGAELLDGDQPILLYCGGGISAAASAFALTLLGRANVKLYDGSLQEWSADPALPMTTGAAPA